MKIKALFAVAIAALLLSPASNAGQSGGHFTTYGGYNVGYHYTTLATNEQGPSSAAFLNATGYRENPNCSNLSSGTLVHNYAVGWYWAVCYGENNGVGRHWTVINAQSFELGGSYMFRRY